MSLEPYVRDNFSLREEKRREENELPSTYSSTRGRTYSRLASREECRVPSAECVCQAFLSPGSALLFFSPNENVPRHLFSPYGRLRYSRSLRFLSTPSFRTTPLAFGFSPGWPAANAKARLLPRCFFALASALLSSPRPLLGRGSSLGPPRSSTSQLARSSDSCLRCRCS